ncbi:MAG: hypothetical protein KDA55_14300, partial [Planctomycetales bacterium]|nr:hypothetical protein [Planctomycetales bacterium]
AEPRMRSISVARERVCGGKQRFIGHSQPSATDRQESARADGLIGQWISARLAGMPAHGLLSTDGM